MEASHIFSCNWKVPLLHQESVLPDSLFFLPSIHYLLRTILPYLENTFLYISAFLQYNRQS